MARFASGSMARRGFGIAHRRTSSGSWLACVSHVRGVDRRVVPVVEAGGVERDLARAEAAHEQLAEVRELREVDDALLVELEHGEEAHHELEAARYTGGERPEAHGLGLGQQPQHRLDRVADAGPHRGDVLGVDHHLGHRGEHPERGRLQRLGAHPFERIGLQEAVRLLRTGAPRNTALGAADARVERGGRVLERLALEQAGEQQVALLEAQ